MVEVIIILVLAIIETMLLIYIAQLLLKFIHLFHHVHAVEHEDSQFNLFRRRGK